MPVSWFLGSDVIFGSLHIIIGRHGCVLVSTVCTHIFCFFFLLCKSILFIEIIQKRISRLRRCFLITHILGGTYGAEELLIRIYYKQDAPLEQLAVSDL